MLADTPRTAELLHREITTRDVYRLGDLRGREFQTVVDIGANYGFFARRVLELFPGARVLCVEPDPLVFQGLQENLRGLPVELHAVALGDGSKVHTELPRYHYNSLGLQTRPGGTTPSYGLHALLQALAVDPTGPLMIKVDCEGAERYLWGNPEDMAVLGACQRWMIEIHYDTPRRHPGCPDRAWYENWLRGYLRDHPERHTTWDLGGIQGLVISDLLGARGPGNSGP